MAMRKREGKFAGGYSLLVHHLKIEVCEATEGGNAPMGVQIIRVNCNLFAECIKKRWIKDI